MTDRKRILEPTGKLSPQDWIAFPETRAVLAALRRDGAAVRFIGGCVRDALAHRPVKDVDIATHDPPEKVMALLEAARIRAIPTGIKHGTVTAVIGQRHFEITTLRIDVGTDGRRATVAFTDDWTADAARRDFTINAMSADDDGNVYDPFNGIGDLAHGYIRFIGRAEDRIKEDALRLLRFFRFYASYGRPPADPEALEACRKLAPLVDGLSGERVRAEMFRILLSPDPAAVAALMRGLGVLRHALPEAGDPAHGRDGIGRLRAVAWLTEKAVKVDSTAPEALRRLAALAYTDRDGAIKTAERLRLSNAERDHLVLLSDPPLAVSPDLDARMRRRAFHTLGAEMVRSMTIVAWGHEIAHASFEPHGRNQAWLGLINDADAWTPIEFPLKGRDAISAGIPAGETMGTLLQAVEAWWIEGDFKAGRDECLAKLNELART
ncbi:MAG: CCA tRNA nucleotidyltransferase [Alphaproteobacteria bacterium]|nr:CCA tRNA nucleotidyltransferase [Alphaproteobacteria bacterium]